MVINMRFTRRQLRGELMEYAARVRDPREVWHVELEALRLWAAAGGVEPTLDVQEGEDVGEEFEAEEEALPPPRKKKKLTGSAGASGSGPRSPPSDGGGRGAGGLMGGQGGGAVEGGESLQERQGGVVCRSGDVDGIGGGGGVDGGLVTLQGAVGAGAVVSARGTLPGGGTWQLRAEGDRREYLARQARRDAAHRACEEERMRTSAPIPPVPGNLTPKIEKITPTKKPNTVSGVEGVGGSGGVGGSVASRLAGRGVGRTDGVRRELNPHAAPQGERAQLGGQTTPPVFVGVDGGQPAGSHPSGEDTQIAE